MSSLTEDLIKIGEHFDHTISDINHILVLSPPSQASSHSTFIFYSLKNNNLNFFSDLAQLSQCLLRLNSQLPSSNQTAVF